MMMGNLAKAMGLSANLQRAARLRQSILQGHSQET